MRGAIPGLASPSPYLTRLPAILQEDDFLQRMLPAFDDALAPVLGVLDNLAAYLDPHLAPADHLEWLASWVDIRVDDAWSVQQRRDIVAGAVALHRRTGTAAGIADAVRLAAGPESSVEVEESGATAWSAMPGAPIPGSDEPGVTVTVTVPDASAEGFEARLARVVRSLVPAHVPCRVQVRTHRTKGGTA
ncbi:phage tail protein [Agromyces sp. CFH 90414]|uniref:Phage tail protein n=1 Tax=Agromyces agglutinans TaxID=2662258 RepID=A0A6I2FCA4_9MICO|nr:phage tail protein [Agromyces agglutinans]MRG59563.1 phage tail protein [Agromyces agglutinans]